MSNFNKVVTNIPVSLTETEMSNLSQTFSGIIQGGGGGGEGKRYIGDGVYVTVNNDANPGVISLTQTSLDKLNKEIPSAVSSFPDSVQYAKITEIPDSITDFADTDTVIYSYLDPLTGDIQQQINGKQNKLQFDLNDKGEISAIGTLNQTTALAGAGGVTGDYYSASNPSGFINSAQAETQILEKHYLTEASGNARYIPIPEGLSDNQYYAYTTSSWKVIQGAGDVSGISTVAHDDTLTGNGNNENLGVDITKIQTKLTDAQIQNITDVTTLKTASSTWDNVSDKLNTSDFNTYTATTAPATYQPIGNYLSSNALEGYATTALLDTISSKIESDIPTTVAQLTDSGNYYKKTETSSKTEITNALNTKVDKPTSIQTGKLVYDGDTSAWVSLPAGTTIIVEGQGSVTANYDSSNSTYTVSLLSSAENALNKVGDKIDTTAVAQTYQTKSDMTNYLTTNDAANTYQPIGNYAPESVTSTVNTLTAASAGWNEVTAKLDKSIYSNASGNWENTYNVVNQYSAAGKWLTEHQSLTNYYTKSETSGASELSTEFAKYQPTGYYATSAGLTAGNQYAMTTTGWEVVQGGTTFTGVVTGVGLSGTGLSNSPLGIDTTAAIYFTNGSAKSAVSADKAESAESAKWLREGNAHVSAGDVTALQHWASSNSSTWDSVTAKLTTAQYAEDSATFVTSSNASISAAGEQYALTTTGWAKVQAGGGSTVTIDTTNNEIKDGTSAVSAMSYVVNPNNAYWKPQRSCVCTEAEISTMAGYANGQGMLFFVVSGHNQ